MVAGLIIPLHAQAERLRCEVVVNGPDEEELRALGQAVCEAVRGAAASRLQPPDSAVLWTVTLRRKGGDDEGAVEVFVEQW